MFFYYVSWLLLVGLQMCKRCPQESKSPWMISPLLEHLPFTSQEICPQLDIVGPTCPLFLSSAHSKGESRNAHPHSIEKMSEINVAK